MFTYLSKEAERQLVRASLQFTPDTDENQVEGKAILIRTRRN
jgi:hypothetical protein